MLRTTLNSLWEMAVRFSELPTWMFLFVAWFGVHYWMLAGLWPHWWDSFPMRGSQSPTVAQALTSADHNLWVKITHDHLVELGAILIGISGLGLIGVIADNKNAQIMAMLGIVGWWAWASTQLIHANGLRDGGIWQMWAAFQAMRLVNRLYISTVKRHKEVPADASSKLRLVGGHNR